MLQLLMRAVSLAVDDITIMLLIGPIDSNEEGGGLVELLGFLVHAELP
jgi:hypothetical protein